MSPVRFARASVVALLVPPVLALGCIFDPHDDDHPPPPRDVPEATTPENALRRFEAEIELANASEYGKLLAQNFRFTFSSQSDPTLAAAYGDSWGKDDELESAQHLFDGFVDAGGVFRPAARSVELTAPLLQELEDPFHPDSLEHYRLVAVPRLVLEITLADDQGFHVDALHHFYLVRGDAAVLEADQLASSERWYVYRWDDLSAPLAAATAGSRWGRTTLMGP